MDKKSGREPGTSANLITFVTDRAGYDLRYAIDASKLKNELGRVQGITLKKSWKKPLTGTLQMRGVKQCYTGPYQQYYADQYNNR